MGGQVGGRSVSVVVVVGGGAAAFDAVLWLSSASRLWPRSWPLVCLCTASFSPASLRVVLCFSALHPSAFSSSSCSSSSSHAQLWHKSQLCHAQLFHTRLCHTHTGNSALLQNAMLSCARTCLLDPVLSHTSIVIRNSFSHNFNQLYLTELFHIQHCHPQHPATLSHTTLPRTTLSDSIVTHGFVTHCHAPQLLRGKLGTYGTGLAQVAHVGLRDPQHSLSLTHTRAHTTLLHTFLSHTRHCHTNFATHSIVTHAHTQTRTTLSHKLARSVCYVS